MKLYFLTSILFLFALISNPANAQVQDDLQNYVVLTKKIPQLQPIFLTAETLAHEDGKNFGKFEVIICGQTVKELTDKNMMQDYIAKAKKHNVELIACGFSLNKFGVDRKDISPELRVVENGILYNLQLQKKGYTSISL
ncbi:sulfur reduction protein DsrE [Antarcticibacterium flavum]|uniref:Sulfur reduction protein DsrE n=1 Tax=Antarcticibacterium flavum TaxID=2058175 RepID=A0A5B7WZK3_9FLAO|nr:MULTISPECIES: DsrE family protein [Antarcticibacterium]MCM4158634.1 sulfur reduction protein DsrE [Antarcticibacterium sp. W02-3]QCY68489.1 sulfur reduction protein DsrE [Antarcticibacterium flavum]